MADEIVFTGGGTVIHLGFELHLGYSDCGKGRLSMAITGPLRVSSFDIQ